MEQEGFAGANAVGAPPPATGAGRRLDWQTEKEAMRIVLEEEEQAGRRVERLTKPRERSEGCDFLSFPPGGGPPDRVEVKGWSAPLMKATKSGAAVFSYGSEVNFEQLERARSDPLWRLEIVANLAAVRAGTGEVQRLSLTGAEVADRARPWKFRVPLEGLESRIKVARADRSGVDVASGKRGDTD
jgi:hypothetical protein